MTEILVQQAKAFLRVYKKLHNNQKEEVDQAIADIVFDPTIGEPKKGDLSAIHHKVAGKGMP